MTNPLGTRLTRGDVVLVPSPFTDLTAEKLRPVVVVSAEPQEFDIVKASVFKMKKLLTIERTKIIRRLGKVSSAIQKELDRRLKEALGL